MGTKVDIFPKLPCHGQKAMAWDVFYVCYQELNYVGHDSVWKS
jgi:hypothetical protein